ncbi:MAG: hypothetical protein U9N10_09140, partial [Bacillota bacterium]|nr:hypothetical protein [Bacillota bacterium]
DIGKKIFEDVAPEVEGIKPVTILTKEKNKYINLDDISENRIEFNVSSTDEVVMKRMTVQWLKDGETLDQREINSLVDNNPDKLVVFNGEKEAVKELLAHLNLGVSNITKIGDVEKDLPADTMLDIYTYSTYPDSSLDGINKVFRIKAPIQTIGNVGWKYEVKLARYSSYTKFGRGVSGIGTIANIALAIHSGYLYGEAMANAGGTAFGVISGITYGALVFASTFLYTMLAGIGPVGWVIIAILVVDSIIAIFVDDYNGVVGNFIASAMSFLFDVEKYPGTYLNRFKVIDENIEFLNLKNGNLSVGSEINLYREYLLRIRAATRDTPANNKDTVEDSYANFYSWNNSYYAETENDKDRTALYTYYNDDYGKWYETKKYEFNNRIIFNKPGKNIKVISKTKLETKLCDEVTYTSYVNGVYKNVKYEWDKDVDRSSYDSYYDIVPDNLNIFYKLMDDFDLEFYDHDGDGLATRNGKEIDGNGNVLKSSPYKIDTDNDGVDDYFELINKTDPTRADTDNDGLSDKEEIIYRTDPLKKDTDSDSISDFDEINKENTVIININGEKITAIVKTNPLKKDTDGDGLSDSIEISRGLNPASKYTNGQKLYDGNKYAPTIIKEIKDFNDVLKNQEIVLDLYEYFEDRDNDKLKFLV